MKFDKRITSIICVVIVSVLALLGTLLLLDSKSDKSSDVVSGQDGTETTTVEYKKPEYHDEFTYNTEIITNPDAPTDDKPEISKIEGYTEIKDQKFLSLPMSFDAKMNGVDTEALRIVSIGSFTGTYIDGEESDVKDILAMVVTNPSDKVLSVASIDVAYDDSKVCSFTPSNIPPKCSALIMSDGMPVQYSDVKKLDMTLKFAVPQDQMTMINGKVGVDFKESQFIVTNLTDEPLGDVYIRYKRISDGNVYYGAKTFSVTADNLLPYETQMVDAPDFDAAKYVVISVENIK